MTRRTFAFSRTAACGILAAILAIAALTAPSFFSMTVFMLLSGAAPVLLARRRWFLVELLAIIPNASLVLWSVFTLLMWKAGAGDRSLSYWPSVIALLCGIVCRMRDTGTVSARVTALDKAAVWVAGLLLLPVPVLYAFNGPYQTEQGRIFVARSWINCDGFYLFALSQMAVERREYPDENPVLAGTENHYPSLLHCGLGELARQGNSADPVAFSIWHLTPVTLASLGALLVFLLRRLGGRFQIGGLLAGIAGLAGTIAMRPDHFAYPHTQLFALGMVMSTLCLCGGHSPRLPSLLAGGAFSVCLVFGHTVSALVAICGMTALAIFHAINRQSRQSAILALPIAINIVLFRLVNSGNMAAPGSRELHFDWQLLKDYGLPYVCAVAVCGFGLFRRWTAASLWCAMLMLITTAYYFYGITRAVEFDRWFACYNVPRFLQFALIAGACVLCTLPRRASWAMIAPLLLAVVALPNPIALETGKLVTDSVEYVVAPELQTYSEIRRNTSPRAAILGNFGTIAPAAFTGRAMHHTEPMSKLFAGGSLESRAVQERLDRLVEYFHLESPQQRMDWIAHNCQSDEILVVGPNETTSTSGLVTPFLEAPARKIYETRTRGGWRITSDRL